MCSEECKCEKLRQENTSPIHIPLPFLNAMRGLGKIDSKSLTPLLQNATIFRRSLDDYFPSRPAQRTVNFFSQPGGIVHDSVMTHPDEVATGSLLFKAPKGTWQEGTYRLVLNHDRAKADVPITLQ